MEVSLHGTLPGVLFSELNEPRLASILDSLTHAEQRKSHSSAARLTALVARYLYRKGNYLAASYWLEWSLQLRSELQSSYAYLQDLTDWATLKLVLGEIQAVREYLQRPSQADTWVVENIRLHLLIAEGAWEEAARLGHRLWQQAKTRPQLMLLSHPFCHALICAGAVAQALEFGEKALFLSSGLEKELAVRARLAYAMALSQPRPQDSVGLLEPLLGELPAPWSAQALAYLVDALGRCEGKAQQVAIESSLLREIQPHGWRYLAGDAGLHFDFASESALRLQFLGTPRAFLKQAIPNLRPRFAEFLVVLSCHPAGLSAEQITLAVYGENQEPACCKTEMNRLKQVIPLESRPYRLKMPVWADFLELPALLRAGRVAEAIELYQGPLLPHSEAPEVCSLRRSLEETLRGVVLESNNPEHLWKLSSRMHEDLELWEALHTRLPQGDPRRGLARAQVNSLRRAWGV